VGLACYLVEIEADRLGIPDGPLGFIANRWVIAASVDGARRKALLMTQRVWERKWVPPGSRNLALTAVRAERVSFVRWSRGLKQNSGHIFYEQDDEG
jgi:hypothetical protein